MERIVEFDRNTTTLSIELNGFPNLSNWSNRSTSVRLSEVSETIRVDESECVGLVEINASEWPNLSVSVKVSQTFPLDVRMS